MAVNMGNTINLVPASLVPFTLPEHSTHCAFSAKTTTTITNSHEHDDTGLDRRNHVTFWGGYFHFLSLSLSLCLLVFASHSPFGRLHFHLQGWEAFYIYRGREKYVVKEPGLHRGYI